MDNFSNDNFLSFFTNSFNNDFIIQINNSSEDKFEVIMLQFILFSILDRGATVAEW